MKKVFQIFIHLLCLKCNKNYSSFVFQKSTEKGAKKALAEWENKLTIVRCSKCGSRLAIVGRIALDKK
jgi:DNA-directed RNA polymerase subunit RPC12/RpoP